MVIAMNFELPRASMKPHTHALSRRQVRFFWEPPQSPMDQTTGQQIVEQRPRRAGVYGGDDLGPKTELNEALILSSA